MPPDGFTTITISDDLATKLAQIVSRYECDSYAEAVKYAVNVTLAQDGELTTKDLIEMLADQVE